MDKANLPWTTKQIAKNMESGKAMFPDDIQRGLVWNKKQKSLLIHSLLIDYTIPPLFATEEKVVDENGKETNVYSFIDGKQRLHAISDFFAGKYALMDLPLTALDDGKEIDINGLTFAELPEELKDNLTTRSLTVFYYKNATLQQKREMYSRYNNGKVLTPIERLKAQAPNYAQIRELGDNKLFDLILSKNERNKFVDDAIVMRTYLLVCKNEYDMSEKNIKAFISEMHFEKDDIVCMGNIFDVLFGVLSSLKNDKETKKIFTKAKKRTNVLGMVNLVDSVLNRNSGDKEKTAEQIESWIKCFYSVDADGTTINSEYNKLTGAGSSQPQNVKRRMEIVKEDFDKRK